MLIPQKNNNIVLFYCNSYIKKDMCFFLLQKRLSNMGRKYDHRFALASNPEFILQHRHLLTQRSQIQGCPERYVCI